MKPALLFSSVIAAALLLASAASAEERSRVVIQADAQSRDSGDVASRIAAELDNGGLRGRAHHSRRPGRRFVRHHRAVVQNGRVEPASAFAMRASTADTHVDANDIEAAGARAAVAIRSVEAAGHPVRAHA